MLGTIQKNLNEDFTHYVSCSMIENLLKQVLYEVESDKSRP